MCIYILSQLPLQTSQYFFRCVGKVIDNNDDAALLEEREELIERQDLGMRRRIRLTHCIQIYSLSYYMSCKLDLMKNHLKLY